MKRWSCFSVFGLPNFLSRYYSTTSLFSKISLNRLIFLHHKVTSKQFADSFCSAQPSCKNDDASPEEALNRFAFLCNAKTCLKPYSKWRISSHSDFAFSHRFRPPSTFFRMASSSSSVQYEMGLFSTQCQDQKVSCDMTVGL